MIDEEIAAANTVDLRMQKGLNGGVGNEGTPKTTGAYNPNLSMDIGNGLGKLNGKSINVSEKGLNLVKKHISQFGDIPENQAMINRIESALKMGSLLLVLMRVFICMKWQKLQ